MTSDICKGCLSITEYGKCIVSRVKGGKVCPCSLCLVKGMCTEPCEEFKVYSDWGWTHDN